MRVALLVMIAITSPLLAWDNWRALPVQQNTSKKILSAEIFFLGQVTAIEKETIELEPSTKRPKVPHCVASIKIETHLYGARNVTHIKVVWPKPEEPVQSIGPNGRPALSIPDSPAHFIPQVGQQGLYFLRRHVMDASYYEMPLGLSPILNDTENYDDAVKLVKGSARIFANPVEAMSGENVEQCMASAILLAEKYRGRNTENNTVNVITDVAVPVEEHKLFMKLLIEANWDKSEAPMLADALCLYPGQFGIPEIYPTAGQSLSAARQQAFLAWYEKFGAKFRVKRLVAKQPAK